MLQEKDASATAQKWADQFAKTAVCPECHGAKLNKGSAFIPHSRQEHLRIVYDGHQ